MSKKLTGQLLITFLLFISTAVATFGSEDPNAIFRKWNAIAVNNFTSVSEVEGRVFVGGNYSMNNAHQYGFKLNGNPSSDIVFAVKGTVNTNNPANIKVFNGSAAIGTSVGNTNWFEFHNGGSLQQNSNWPADNDPVADITAAADYWKNLASNSTVQIPGGQPGPLKFICSLTDEVAVFNVTDVQTFENSKVQQIEIVPSPLTKTIIINVESVDGSVNWNYGNMVGNLTGEYWRSRTIWNVYTSANGGDMGNFSSHSNIYGALVAPTANVSGNSNFDGPVVAENIAVNSEIHLASTSNGGWNGEAPYDDQSGGGCDLSGLTTFTQGGWGANAAGNNPGSVRDAHFNSVFPGGMEITGGPYTLTFSTSADVAAYLPSGGPSSAMSSSLTNPTGNNAGGVLGGQVTALTLNVMYDDAGVFGNNSFKLGELVITNGTFQSMSVYNFLALAQTALTGGNAQGYTFSQINSAATAINENFDNGTVDEGFLTCPSAITGSLGDKVWYDIDADGIQEAGENGVSGVEVTLYNSSDTFLASENTDQNGNYLFENLPAGDYYVVFDLPAGYQFTAQNQGSNENVDSDANTTTGKSDVVTLPEGDNITNVDAGLIQLKASLGNFVFNDVDHDGIQDGGEAGVPQVKVELYNNSNALLDSTVTDGNGIYSFTNLDPGSYYVKFYLPEGFVFSPQNAGSNDNIDSDANTTTGITAAVTLAGGDNNVTLDAGIYDVRGSLGNFVFYDNDKDGIQDNGEAGIGGVSVELYTCADSLITTTVTAANGSYLFQQLMPEDYYVKFILPAGHVFTTADAGSDDAKDSDANVTTGKTACVTIAAGETNLTVDAGMFEPKSSLGDLVFIDTNENGVKDNSEPGIENVPVELYTCADVLVATTVTDSFGNYIFSGLDAGDYYVKVTKPSGYYFISQNVGSDDTIDSDVDPLTGKSACVTLGVNETNLTVDAGLFQPASGLGDFVFEDTDKDGIQDNGETGIPAVVVKLYDCSDNYISTTLTNNAGWYHFDNIPAGDYYVKFVLPNGYNFSPVNQGGDDTVDSDADPVTGKTSCITLAANTVDTSYDAGMYQQPSDVDLAITKTVNNANPDDGDNVVFTITVTNNGPSAASDIVVSDLLQSGFVFVSASASVGSYDGITGEWEIPALANGASATLNITGQIDLGIVQAFNLADATGYNLFVFDDLVQPSSDTEGKVAVGGNAFLQSYSVGDKLANSNGLVDVLVVGNHLEYVSGRVYNGNTVYGVSTNLPKTVVSIDGTLRQDNIIDFTQAEINLKGLSNSLSGYTVNAIDTVEFGTLNLTGSNPYMNVFDVDGNELNAAHTVNISVPNGSVVLVNVSGSTINWNGGLFVNGTAINNVLYNFYEATDLTISAIDVRGSVLAPYADLHFPSGVINGQVIVKSMTGQGQFNNQLFAGNIPVDPNLTNCADILSSVPADNNAANNTACVAVVVGNVNTGGGNGGGQTNYEWTPVASTGISDMIWVLENDLSGKILAGTVGGKIYRIDGNNTELLNPGMHVGFIWDIALDASGKIYAGTEAGLYYSTDNGASWAGPIVGGKDVRAVATDGFGNVYAGTWGFGVFKSEDNGSTWNEVNNGIDFTAVHALTVDANSIIYAGTYGGGVYKSDDFGASWSQTNIPYDYVWALNVTSNGDVFAGTYGSGVYMTEDGGDNWSLIGGTASYVYSITVDAADNVYVTTWSSGVYMLTLNGPANDGAVSGSGKGGNTVNSVNTISWMKLGLDRVGVNSLVIDPSATEIYAGGENGTMYKLNLSGVTGVEDDTEADAEIPTEFELNQNYPNPFNPSTVISFGIKEEGAYRLSVYNLIGEEVAVLVNGDLSAGYYNFTFNAANLSSGIYIYRLHGKNVNLVKKMVFLK